MSENAHGSALKLQRSETFEISGSLVRKSSLGVCLLGLCSYSFTVFHHLLKFGVERNKRCGAHFFQSGSGNVGYIPWKGKYTLYLTFLVF